MTADSIGTLLVRHIMARREDPGGGEPGDAGADHGDFEAGFGSHVG
jgi:hypothetical protein